MSQNILRHSLLRFRNVRERTFVNSPFQNAKELAEAGLYYVGYGCICACFSCGVAICDWTNKKISPLQNHRIHRSSCHFLRDMDDSLTMPSPFSQILLDSPIQSHLPRVDYFCDPAMKMLLFDDDSFESPPETIILPPVGDALENIALPITVYVRLPKLEHRFAQLAPHEFLIVMRREEERIKTFQKSGWHLATPSIREMTEAGFYHLQVADFTQCAFCLLVVSLWKTVNARELHCERSPNCPLMKNQPCGNIRFFDPPSVVDKTLCVVCFENERNILFYPCKHLVSCIMCGTKLNIKKCFVCRQEIAKRELVYL